MTNRLASSASIYLRQHADNPVDWWEWGAAPFAEARRRGVPVLLSVGYASCHWCHVMAHESFEDPRIAALINRDFVPIKVDREQRPDVDAIYMAATQALTGQGGWPMTVFLTADGRPFYAGTYFPPQPRGGLPAFDQVLTAISATASADPDQVASAAARITDAIAGTARGLGRTRLTGEDLDRCRAEILGNLDRSNGGFGGAPKFPPAMTLQFLLRNHRRTGSTAALDAVTLTLDHMARGGIYDQLAGGFARYSVDSTWHVPHFEKMLDDNAQLLRLYAQHACMTGSDLCHRIADETAAFLLREMRAEDGTFIASLDADTDGVEGLTYRWSLAELRDVLGGDDADRAAAIYRLEPDRAETDGQVLRLSSDAADPVRDAGIRTRLLAARAQRPQPGRDEIVVMRGNGLAITALAEAGAALGRDGWIRAAETAADALADTLRARPGEWRRSALHGVVGPGRAMLADEACVAAGLLALYQATGHARWIDRARQLLDDWPTRYRDAGGEYFDAPASPPDSDPVAADGPVIARPRDPTDGAAPSGLASAADALVTAAALTGQMSYRDAAEEISASVGRLVQRFPRSAGWHLCVAEAMAAGPVQVAIGGPRGAAHDELVAAARRFAPSGSVIEVGGDDPAAGAGQDPVPRPLLDGRTGVGGRPAAYVCRGFVCDRPVTDVEDLRQLLTA